MTSKTVIREITFLKNGGAWVEHICVTPDGCAFYSPMKPRKSDVAGFTLVELPKHATMDEFAARVKDLIIVHTTPIKISGPPTVHVDAEERPEVWF